MYVFPMHSAFCRCLFVVWIWLFICWVFLCECLVSSFVALLTANAQLQFSLSFIELDIYFFYFILKHILLNFLYVMIYYCVSNVHWPVLSWLFYARLQYFIQICSFYLNQFLYRTVVVLNFYCNLHFLLFFMSVLKSNKTDTFA